MKFSHPLSPAQVTGKQTLTGNKPITKIHEAIHELQQKVVTDINVNIAGIKFVQSLVRGNVLFLHGKVDGGRDIDDLVQRIDELENKLQGMKLVNSLDITGGNVVLDSRLILGDGSVVAAERQSIPVEAC